MKKIKIIKKKIHEKLIEFYFKEKEQKFWFIEEKQNRTGYDFTRNIAGGKKFSFFKILFHEIST